jgi:hypothetical protein
LAEDKVLRGDVMNRQAKIFRRRVIAFFVVITLFANFAVAKYSGGSGDPNDPYQIANVADLMTLANDVNDYNKCFILTADIDLDPDLPGGQVFTTAVIAPDTNSSSYTLPAALMATAKRL